MEEISVNAITTTEHYRTVVSARNHQLIVDEPNEEGGTDLSMTPMEMLAGALASCTSITLRMYADRKEWKIDEFKVEVRATRDTASNSASLVRTISFIGEIDAKQKERLLAIANACPVHKTLSGKIKIETALS